MAKSTSLEIVSNGAWRAINVVEALKTNQHSGRCIECQEPVRVHRASRNGMAAHVEHLRRNSKCSLSDARATVVVTDVFETPRGAGKQGGAPVIGTEPSPSENPAVTPDDLARWRRQLLRLFDDLEQKRVPNAGPASRLAALRDANRVPRNVAALMKVVLETRNATEYENQQLTWEEGVATRRAWDAVAAWAKRQGLGI